MNGITIFNSTDFGTVRDQRVTIKQAAGELQMSILTVQCLMKEGRLPIGYAQKKEGRQRYLFYIYRHLLDEHKRYLGLGFDDIFCLRSAFR